MVGYTNYMADDPIKNTSTVAAPPAPPPQPVAPVSHAPEVEPIPSKPAEVKTAEPTPEKKLAPEVVEYIKKTEETIKIPDALQEIGVVADAKDQDFSNVIGGPKLPMTDEQIVTGLKQPMSMSVRWLSLFMLYILQQAHYTIKTVKGHVIRVVKP